MNWECCGEGMGDGFFFYVRGKCGMFFILVKWVSWFVLGKGIWLLGYCSVDVC